MILSGADQFKAALRCLQTRKPRICRLGLPRATGCRRVPANILIGQSETSMLLWRFFLGRL